MLSRISKIGVFAIVALMLALGLTATDVFAQTYLFPDADQVHEPTELRASGNATSITFVLRVAGQVDAAGGTPATPAREVTIVIPSEWTTRPIEDNGDTSPPTEAGEVTFTKDTVSGRTIGYVSGRNLNIKVAAAAAGNGDYTVVYYNAAVPHRKGNYRFPIRNAGTSYVEVEVGWAPSGSGTIALTSHQPSAVKDHAWKDKYVVTDGQALGDLRFVYTAAGSMPGTDTADATSGSAIHIALTGFGIATGEVADAVVLVSGSGTPQRTIATDGSTVTATVKAAGGLERGNAITIVIKGLKAPMSTGDSPTTLPSESGFSFTATVAVHPDTAGTGTIPDNKGVFEFYTSAKAGIGELGITSGNTALAGFAQNTAVVAGTDLGTLTLGITGVSGVGPDAKYQIKVPSAFPAPITAPTTVGGDIKSDQAGHTAGGTPNTGARTISGNLTSNASPPAVESVLASGITYRVGKMDAQGKHEFILSTSAGPHTALTARTGGGYHRYIDVTAPHDSGSYVVNKGGSPFVASMPTEVHDLELVYSAAGYMPSGSVTFNLPTGWTNFRNDNADGQNQPGEVTANVPITVTSTTVVASGNWNAGTQIRVQYKQAKVPGAANSAPVEYDFTASVVSFSGATAATETHKVGAGRTADGSGALTVSPESANSNSPIDLALTYTAHGHMPVGSQVKVTIPTGWPKLNVAGTTLSIGDEGSAASLVSDADSMTATSVVALNKDNKIVFKINGVTTPQAGGTYEFAAASRVAAPNAALKSLSGGARVTINQVTSGTVALSSTTAQPDEALGNMTITFTAGARMQSGSKLTVQIPEAFPSVRPDNDDGIEDRGEVTLTGAAGLTVSGGGGTPWVLTATANAVIEVGGTLVITYRDVVAPTAEGVYTFTAMASVVAGQALLPISNQPTFTVRKTVTAIAMTSDPDPAVVFTGGSIEVTVTLWAGTEAGKALGNQNVMLSDGDAGGSFDPASIMIADNMHEGSSTYTSSMAGTPTLTATLGDLTPATVDATIKSKIRDARASKTLVTQGETITVSAIGQTGTGTVTIRDADGDKVGLTRALDPIGDPDADGDQQYERAITLPDPLADGTYTLNITINDDTAMVEITVLNDQSSPMLSDATVLPMTVVNGNVITLTVKAMSASASNPITSVSADVSMVDSTQTDAVMLSKQAGTDNTYVAIHTVSMDNTNADGMVDVTFTATNQIGNSATATASVALANDPSTLDSVTVPSDMFRPDDMVTITATGTAGQSVKFTVTSSDGTEMPSGQAMMEEPADSGMYMGTFAVVADVHTEGMYDVTVTMNDNPAKSISKADSLNIGPAGYMFTLSIPAGTHAIHIPLDVNMINGEDGTIETVGDVYDALGDAVNFIISFVDGSPISYLGDQSAGSMADAAIGDDTGLIAVMTEAATLELMGDALGTGGVSQINISPGSNLVGVPLDPTVDMMISDALVTGVAAIAVSNAAGDGFHTITAAGDMGDGPVMGGVGYVVVYTGMEDASIPIVGSAWENEGAAAAPAVVFSGTQTPVLHVDGGIMDEFDMLARIPELRVTVKNLSTGASLDTVVGTEASAKAYSGTFVELSRHAAKAGDVLEIIAHSPNPLVGVRPVPQIVVSAEEVLTSRIELPDLELYEIPSETQLLSNYPNPFNPETWIPYRLAQAAKVTLEIYDTNGRLVRSIDVGFKPAAVYESRASAIYWDGRNNYGERVASGTYFYHLIAGDDYASTRRMVILK